MYSENKLFVYNFNDNFVETQKMFVTSRFDILKNIWLNGET